MKTLATLLLLTATTLSFARVGIERFSHTVSAETEELVLEKVEAAIPLIKKGKIKSPFQTRCWPNNSKTIKVRSVTTNKAYKYIGGELVQYFTGKINYIHKRCRD